MNFRNLCLGQRRTNNLVRLERGFLVRFRRRRWVCVSGSGAHHRHSRISDRRPSCRRRPPLTGGHPYLSRYAGCDCESRLRFFCVPQLCRRGIDCRHQKPYPPGSCAPPAHGDHRGLRELNQAAHCCGFIVDGIWCHDWRQRSNTFHKTYRFHVVRIGDGSRRSPCREHVVRP